jgi:hypothetical protein
MILINCCFSNHEDANNSVNYWLIGLPLIGGLITLIVNLVFKNNQRKADIVDKLHSDIHAACDNILFTALQVNGFNLSKNFFYHKHLLNKGDTYFLSLAVKHDESMNTMLSRFYNHSSELITQRYLMKKYLSTDITTKMDKLIMEEDDRRVPFVIKDYTQTFMGVTSDATLNNIFLAEQVAITKHVYENSTGKRIDEIRRLIASDV